MCESLSSGPSQSAAGGQRQRVALARTLIKKPKVLLLDEPLGALHKKLREQMQIELRSLQQQVGITFLFVTHDQEEALTLSDRIAVMSEGNVLEIASPSELYESPKTPFVADFIGTMNFFEGKVSSTDGQSINIQTPALGSVHATTHGRLTTGADILVAIRPEKLRLQFERPQQAENVVPGRMGPSAYLGDRSHLYVQLENRPEPVSVALQNLESSADRIRTPDQDVWLWWTPESVVLLPAQ